MKAVAILLGALLALPGAWAAPAQGVLHLAGPATFQAPSVHSGGALTAYCGSTGGVGSFILRASRVHVDAYEADYVDAQTPVADHVNYRTGLQHASYDLTDVTATLSGDPAPGWLGVDLFEGGSLLANATAGASLAQEDGILGNGPTGDNPEAPAYAHRVDGGLVLGSVASWEYAGKGSVKVSGLSLDLRARENETVLATGWSRGEGPVATLAQRWALLAFPAGSLSLASALPCSVALRSDAARWTGEAVLTGASGVLDVGGRSYEAQGGPATVAGALHADATPAGQGMDLRLEGDVQTTSLASANVPTSATGLVVWPWIALAALAVTGGGALALLRPRKREGLALGAEELAALAEIAAESDQFDDALAWNARARDASRTSARLWLDEGYYLERLGRTDEAFAAYRTAAELGAPGDARLCEARLLLKLGSHSDAESSLIEALRASPASVLEAESPDFAPLARRPRVRAAMDEARRIMERG